MLEKLLGMGLNVMPLKHRDSPDSKRPVLASWRHLQTQRYSGEFPKDCNLAVICGSISKNLIVLDLDDQSLYDKFHAYHNKTFTVQTGKKGYHFYFRHDGTVKTKRLVNSSGSHIDLQSDGTYVVAPGSKHPDTGNEYTIICDAPIMTIQLDDLHKILTDLGFNPVKRTEHDLAFQPMVAEGDRDSFMFAYACYLRRMNLSPQLVRHEMERANERRFNPPLNEQDMDRIFRSALRYKIEPYFEDKPPPTTEKISLQKITPELENKPVEFEAMIIAAGEKQTFTEQANFICPGCGATSLVHCDRFYAMIPPRCSKCKIACEMDYDTRVLKYIQQIRIQEFLEQARNNTPVEFDADIIGSDVGEAFIGDRKLFVGKFRSMPPTRNSKRGLNTIVFEILDMSDMDQKVGCMPTQEELDAWKNDPGIYDKVVDSLAPELLLRRELKETCMMAMAGGISINGKRSNIHVAFIGDAQLAKSELLERVSETMVGSAYAVGRQASNAGLTIGMAKLYNDTMVPRAGLIPTHTGNLVCLDEVDKMKQEDREGILECMEQGHATLNKVGYPNTRLAANTTIIAAGNPKNGKFNPEYPSIMDNFVMDVPFISRFDILWLLTDDGNKEEDRKIRNHIRKFRKGSECMEQDALQRFFSYVRTIPVTIPDTLEDSIDKMHEEIRELSDLNELELGWRIYYGLYRLVSASARLHLRDVATPDDVIHAKRILFASLDSLRVDGHIKVRSQRQTKDDTFLTIWNKVSDDDCTVSRNDFISLLSRTEPYNAITAPIEFEKYKDSGRIELINSTGRYRFV